MKLIINQEKENSLLKRKEIQANIDSDCSLSFNELIKIVSEKYSVSPENIKVNTIKGKFGSKNFEVEFYIYDSKKIKETFDSKTRKQRDTENKAKIEARKTASAEKKKSVENKEETKE